MINRAAVAAAVAAIAAAAGTASAAQPNKISAFDRHFLVAAAQNDKLELATASAYERRGGTQGLCDLAGRIVKDHLKSSRELSTLASQLGVNLPRALDPLLQFIVKQLSMLTPATAAAGTAGGAQTLDDGFSNLQIAAHRHAILEFDEAARAADDDRVRAFAKRMLPMLHEHLKLAMHAEDQAKTPTGGRCAQK